MVARLLSWTWTTARKVNFYGGSLCHTPRLHSRVSAALLPLTLSGIKKYRKQLLPDSGKFIFLMHRTTRLERPPRRSGEIEDKPILGDGPAGTLNASEGHWCLPTKEESFVSIDVHMIRQLMALVRKQVGDQ